MARKPGTSSVGEFALFDVVYEDGSQRSNRRVPLTALGGLDGDESPSPRSPSRTAIWRGKIRPARAHHQDHQALRREIAREAQSSAAIKCASRDRAKTCVGHPARPA